MTPELLSVEAWGGATYDVALRFLGEDPWERLAALREALPNIASRCCCAAATRSATRRTRPRSPTPSCARRPRPASTSSASSTRSTTSSRCARRSTRCSRPARRRRGRALLHRRPARPGRDLYTLDYYLRARRADRRRRRARPRDQGHGGAAARPGRREARHGACASASTCRCTCTPTTPQAASWRRCWPRAAPASTRSTSRAPRWPAPRASPPLSALVAAHRHTERDTGLASTRSCDLEPYWEAVRRLYRPFESGLPGPTGRVYHHEIPGGQLSNLRQQAIALGLADDFELIEDMYAAANRHPRPRRRRSRRRRRSSATSPCTSPRSGADPTDFAENPEKYDIPDSVIGFMAGELGDLPGGWPEPFRTKVLDGPHRQQPASTELTDEQTAGARGQPTRRHDAEPAALPRADQGLRRGAASPSATSRSLDTADYLYGLRPGEEHVVEIERGRAALRRPRGDRRGRRQGHAHGHDHDQRPAPPGLRARPSRSSSDVAGAGEGRPRTTPARSPRRSPAS